MTYLRDLHGKQIAINGAPLPQRKRLNFRAGVNTVLDVRDRDGATDVEIGAEFNPTLAEVLAAGNDAGGAQLLNIGESQNPNSAALRSYLDSRKNYYDSVLARMMAPQFDFNPEMLGLIQDDLPGYSFTRATVAYTIERSGDVYTLVQVGSGVPRYAEHPTLGNGYWAEPAATNLLTRSSEFEDAAWGKGDVTMVDNAVVAPDGTMTAARFDGTGSTTHTLFRDVTSAATTNTFSVYVKAGVQSWVYMQMFVSGDNGSCYFDVANGVVGTLDNGLWAARISGPYNGYYRVELTATTGALSGHTIRIRSAEADNDTGYAGATGDLFLWNAQVETGPIATSPIVTAGSTATRNADILTYGAVANGVLDAVGSWVVEWTGAAGATSGANRSPVAAIDNTAADNGVVLRSLASTNVINAQIRSGAADSANMNAAATNSHDGARHSVAVSYALNDFKIFVDGTLRNSDSSGNAPVGIASLYIGTFPLGTSQLNGIIHRARYYNRHGVHR